jgi:hypothetical protein
LRCLVEAIKRVDQEKASNTQKRASHDISVVFSHLVSHEELLEQHASLINSKEIKNNESSSHESSDQLQALIKRRSESTTS